MGHPYAADELQVGLLGSLAVSRRTGAPITIASRPQRRLLSILALHVGDIVRSSSLEDWAALSPGALRTSVSRLRRVIGPDALETTVAGYRLRADVDVVAFEQLAGLAPELADAEARAVLDDAVRLWRDDPLVEFTGEPWTDAALRRLSERRASALEDLAVLQLDAGEHSAALVTIQSLVDSEPYRERPRALLLRALAEEGRQTEALRAFQSYRSLLGDEIGIEPSAALVELDRAIAASIDTSAPIGPWPGHSAWGRTRRTAPMPPGTHHHRPPVPLSSFVGRDQDVSTVVELIATQRLVTLTGAGGCGKTRLAIAAAAADVHQHRTVTRWVDLGVVSTPSHVVELVAAAVGVTPRPHVDLTDQLVDHLAESRPMLLVLDNAEHVLVPVSELLAAILPHCPSLRALVTSREALAIPGERVWHVPSLSTPPPDAPPEVDALMSYDAVRLFVERARATRPDLATDAETLRHIASICIGVDGLPLAVELAAARVRTHPVEAVAEGVNDAVRWQAARTRAPLARHATLHASIAWSVDLADPLARAVLIRLSVFQASFSLAAACDVGCDDESPEDVIDAIASLVDANLLRFDGAADRFTMLHTVRRFCSLRAQGGTELERASERHARHVATYCEEIGRGHHGIERGPFIRQMPDLIAAMDWAREHDPRLMFRICAGLASVRSVLGNHRDVADTWAWLLSLDRGAGTGESWREEWATAVASQMAAATIHWIDVSSVVDEVGRSLPADAHRARGWAGRGAAMRPAYQGHLGPILSYADDVRARSDDLEYSVYGGFAAYMLALVGRIDESAHHVDELARLTRRHSSSFSVDTVGNGFAAAVIADLVRGDLRAAAGRAGQATPDDASFSMTAAAALAHVALVTDDRPTLDRAVEWSRQRTIPLLRFLPTFIDLVRRRFDGDIEHAADLAEQYWEEAEPVPVSRLHPLPVLTAALIETGRIAAARDMTERAASLVDGMDPAPLLSAGVMASRALIGLRAGELTAARVALRTLLGITVENGFVLMTIDALDRVVEATDDVALAATVRAATTRERMRIRGSLPHPETWPPLTGAVRVAQDWLSTAVPAPAVG